MAAVTAARRATIRAAGTKAATGMGPVGMWVNGVAIFNTLDGGSYSSAAGDDQGGGHEGGDRDGSGGNVGERGRDLQHAGWRQLQQRGGRRSGRRRGNRRGGASFVGIGGTRAAGGGLAGHGL